MYLDLVVAVIIKLALHVKFSLFIVHVTKTLLDKLNKLHPSVRDFLLYIKLLYFIKIYKKYLFFFMQFIFELALRSLFQSQVVIVVFR